MIPMNRAVIATIVLLGMAGGQEVSHAPTLQACTADMNLWWSEVPANADGPDVRTGTKSLTVKEMHNRIAYIYKCGSAYPQLQNVGDPSRMPRTTSLLMMYQVEIEQRLSDFIERHSLLSKFYEEDDAGQR